MKRFYIKNSENGLEFRVEGKELKPISYGWTELS